MDTPEPSDYLSLSEVRVLDERYRCDFELLDRYLGFSAEIGRLSLACFAGIGFITGLLFKNGEATAIVHRGAFVLPMSAALVFLSVAEGLSMAHRYYASDGFYHHLRAIKHLILASERLDTPKDAVKIRSKARKDEKLRNSKYKQSGKYLKLASIALSAGVISTGMGLVAVFIGS